MSALFFIIGCLLKKWLDQSKIKPFSFSLWFALIEAFVAVGGLAASPALGFAAPLERISRTRRVLLNAF